MMGYVIEDFNTADG